MNGVTLVNPRSPAVEKLQISSSAEGGQPTSAQVNDLVGRRIGFRIEWPSFHVFTDEVGSQLMERYGVSSVPAWDLDVEEGNPYTEGGRAHNLERAEALLQELVAVSDAIVYGLAN